MIGFGRWIPLDQAAAQAPPGAGVYQVKLARGLVSYPTGKSAMIHYGAAPDLCREMAELAAAHTGREWMCRFGEGLTPREVAAPDGIVQELVDRFRRRFGAPPTWPDDDA